MVLGSARAVIYHTVKHFGLKRQDHILVPDFLCQSILNILNTTSFPVKYPDERTRAVLVFHQWGYPQKMDEVMGEAKRRGFIVVEDCAHAFDSKYKGRLVGTFGDAAVFSFAKMFPTYLGGVLLSENEELMRHVSKERQLRNNFSNRLFNFFAFKIAKRSFEKGKSRFWLDLIYLKSIHYLNVGKKALEFLPSDITAFTRGLSARRANYLYLRGAIRREYLIPDWEDDIEANPILMPVFLPSEKLPAASQTLLKAGILAEVLHFDVNRNVFAANYRKCLAIPCHQEIEKEQLSLIAETINRI